MSFYTAFIHFNLTLYCFYYVVATFNIILQIFIWEIWINWIPPSQLDFPVKKELYKLVT